MQITLVLPVLILVMMLPVSALSQDRGTEFDCSPLALPVGTQPEVISRATEFLIKAESLQIHPYWPGSVSGVTIGIGWDLGYHSVGELQSAWAELGDETLHRLSVAAGKKGESAQSFIGRLRSVYVPPDVSKHVLTGSLQTYYYPFVTNHFPGITKLPAEAEVVLISLMFNRGVSMGHEPDWRLAKEVDSRWEFRELRTDVQNGDLFAIYTHLGTMKRLWETPGGQGLRVRRRDEQALIRPYVDKQLQWERHCGGPVAPRPEATAQKIKH